MDTDEETIEPSELHLTNKCAFATNWETALAHHYPCESVSIRGSFGSFRLRAMSFGAQRMRGHRACGQPAGQSSQDVFVDWGVEEGFVPKLRVSAGHRRSMRPSYQRL